MNFLVAISFFFFGKCLSVRLVGILCSVAHGALWFEDLRTVIVNLTMCGDNCRDGGCYEEGC